LSSGNLPTINRSLILEEHGGINAFGPQFGIELQKLLNPNYTILFSAQDNRGSFNAAVPHFAIGNSLSAKVNAASSSREIGDKKLTWRVGMDITHDIRDRVFPLLTAISQTNLGGVITGGNKSPVSSTRPIPFPFSLIL
jgi:hypothetical protein